MEINLGNTKGFVRNIGKEGRVCVPKEFLKSLGIEDNGKIEMFLLEDGLYLRRKED